MSECVAKGNSEYAFYSAYYGDSHYSPVLSDLCKDVTPICSTSSVMCKELVNHSSSDCNRNRADSRIVSSDLKNRIEEARSLEENVNQLSKEAVENERLRNEYHTVIRSVEDKIEGKVGESKTKNIYALYETEVKEMLNKWKKWSKKNKDASSAELSAQLAAIKEEEKVTIAELRRKHEALLRKEEEERRLEARRQEEERRRQEAEEARRKQEEEQAMVERWMWLNEEAYFLTSHLTAEDYDFLVKNEQK